MPTSAAGNKPAPHGRQGQAVLSAPCPCGFTLIELMVVVALIAIATASVVLSLRDSAADALERDAQRLAALLESARAQSRANGTPVWWQVQDDGFAWRGLAAQTTTPPGNPAATQAWLSPYTRAQPGPALVLGPEPLIAPQQVTLYSTQSGQIRWRVLTDGLRPFTVQREAVRGAS